MFLRFCVGLGADVKDGRAGRDGKDGREGSERRTEDDRRVRNMDNIRWAWASLEESSPGTTVAGLHTADELRRYLGRRRRWPTLGKDWGSASS